MLKNQDRKLILVREKIAVLPMEAQQKIDEAERIIDQALLCPGWFNIGIGLAVFPTEEKIDEVIKGLIQDLYSAGGYATHWRNGSNIIVMSN